MAAQPLSSSLRPRNSSMNRRRAAVPSAPSIDQIEGYPDNENSPSYALESKSDDNGLNPFYHKRQSTLSTISDLSTTNTLTNLNTNGSNYPSNSNQSNDTSRMLQNYQNQVYFNQVPSTTVNNGNNNNVLYRPMPPKVNLTSNANGVTTATVTIVNHGNNNNNPFKYPNSVPMGRRIAYHQGQVPQVPVTSQIGVQQHQTQQVGMMMQTRHGGVTGIIENTKNVTNEKWKNTKYYLELIAAIKQSGNSNVSKDKRAESLFWLTEQVKQFSEKERIGKILGDDIDCACCEFEVYNQLFNLIMCEDYFIDIKPNNEHFRWLFARCWMDLTQWVACYFLHLFGGSDNSNNSNTNNNNNNNSNNNKSVNAKRNSGGSTTSDMTADTSTEFSFDCGDVESKYSDDQTNYSLISFMSNNNNKKNSIVNDTDKKTNNSGGKNFGSSSNKKHKNSQKSKLDSKSGLWVDILCMLTNDQIQKVSYIISKIDKQHHRTLWDLLKSYLIKNHIDSNKNFYQFFELLCDSKKNKKMENFDGSHTIEHAINEDLQVLIINYQSKHWRDLKERFIQVICKYRLMNGVLTHIFNEFKYNCVIKNTSTSGISLNNSSLYKPNTLQYWLVHDLKGSGRTGKALAHMVHYWENSENKHSIICEKLKRSMEQHIFGAKIDLWTVTTAMFIRQFNKDSKQQTDKRKQLLSKKYFSMYHETLEHTINLQKKQNKWSLALFRAMLC